MSEKLDIFRYWAEDYQLRNGLPARITALSSPSGKIFIEVQDSDGRWYSMAPRHESGRLNEDQESPVDLVLKT